MSTRKQRLTVSIDPALVEVANAAVASGRAPSVSGWVTAAMAEKAMRERRLELLGAAIDEYEAEFGEITPEDIAAQRRADRESALVVRGRRRATTPKSA